METNGIVADQSNLIVSTQLQSTYQARHTHWQINLTEFVSIQRS